MNNSKRKKVVIIGGGASGMIAGIIAARNGAEVTILEKNEKLGKKLYLTGKGKCNLLNYTNEDEFLKNVVNNSKFLLSSVYTFSPFKTYEFFESLGLPLEVQRGNRVFPKSLKSSDVIKVLQNELNRLNVNINLNHEVSCILIKENSIQGAKLKDNQIINCDSLIIATGGKSYPLTGSTGDGYAFSEYLGHKIIEPKPALCGIILKDYKDYSFEGLTLKNIELKINANNKEVYRDTGELLFTHKGISGPLVLTASSKINRLDLNNLLAIIDLKPYATFEELDKRLLDIFKDGINKDIVNILSAFIPISLISYLLKLSSIPLHSKVNSITKEQRFSLIKNVKGLKYNIASLEDFQSAIITSGGVSVSEINPKTMESKLIHGVYFAGEVIDVDAYTGGFNLQIAFSTGYVAGLYSTKD